MRTDAYVYVSLLAISITFAITILFESLGPAALSEFRRGVTEVERSAKVEARTKRQARYGERSNDPQLRNIRNESRKLQPTCKSHDIFFMTLSWRKVEFSLFEPRKDYACAA